MLYEIRVQGYLAPQRFRGFEGWTVAHYPNRDTILASPSPDQAARYGLRLWWYNAAFKLKAAQYPVGLDQRWQPNTKRGRQILVVGGS